MRSIQFAAFVLLAEEHSAAHIRKEGQTLSARGFDIDAVVELMKRHSEGHLSLDLAEWAGLTSLEYRCFGMEEVL